MIRAARAGLASAAIGTSLTAQAAEPLGKFWRWANGARFHLEGGEGTCHRRVNRSEIGSSSRVQRFEPF
jgi:hypothetical protein